MKRFAGRWLRAWLNCSRSDASNWKAPLIGPIWQSWDGRLRISRSTFTPACSAAPERCSNSAAPSRNVKNMTMARSGFFGRRSPAQKRVEVRMRSSSRRFLRLLSSFWLVCLLLACSPASIDTKSQPLQGDESRRDKSDKNRLTFHAALQ